MMTLGRVTFWVFVGLVALPVLAAGAFLLEASYRPNYDENNDYGRYPEVFSYLREQLAHRDPTSQDTVDLSALNGGRWTTGCLFGGYTNPLGELQSRGALIDDRDRNRLSAAKSHGFRVSAVEEFEALISYIDESNRAHFIHFERGIGASGQHLQECVSKPGTMIALGSP